MKKNEKPLLQAEIKHRAISEAAKRIFLQHGFKSASMDEVAREAGVSKRTVYDHFGDKQELFKTILKEHWSALSWHRAELFVEKKTITENLHYFSHVFLKFLYQQDTINLFRLLISEAPQFPDLAEHIITSEKAPYTQALADYLQSQKIKGKLTIENANRSASFFMGLLKEYHFWPMMLGFTKQKQLPNQSSFIDEVVEVFRKAYQPKENLLPKKKLKK